MKKICVVIFMIILFMIITGCHKINNNNNLNLIEKYSREDLKGCYKMSDSLVITDDKIVSNDYKDTLLKINNSSIDICNGYEEDCINISYNYNNNIFVLDVKDEMFNERKDVLYFNLNDEKVNLLIRTKIYEYTKIYSYYRKVECQNEE